MDRHESSSLFTVDAELFFRARVSFEIYDIPENATVLIDSPDATCECELAVTFVKYRFWVRIKLCQSNTNTKALLSTELVRVFEEQLLL